MKTVAIVQARLGSSRLPAKVLLPLPTGRTVIEEVAWGLNDVYGRIDHTVVAIPETAGDETLAVIVSQYVASEQKNCSMFRGPEFDVLARYWLAAKEVEADVIVRITADCPCWHPEVVTDVIDLRKQSQVEYASNIWPERSFAHGYDCEVFTMDALQKAHEQATDPYDREHVTPWMQRNCATALHRALVDNSHVRLTLDTIKDYHRICQVMRDDAFPCYRAA